MSSAVRALLVCGGLLAAALLARHRWSQGAELYTPGDDPASLVEVAVTEAASTGTSMRTWEVRFPGRSGTAHFDIDLEMREAKSGEWFASTSGAFRSRADSKPEDLLAALARAHHGTRRGKDSSRAPSVPFDAALMGQALSRGGGAHVIAGAFTDDPKGPWIVVKIFLPSEGAELFIALNPSEGVGLLFPKDDENWPDLEPVLASVL